MGTGSQRNQPCWCGSGQKFKRCHLGRERDDAPARSESLKVFRATFGRRECLHPKAPSECVGPIVRAHTVSRAAGLRHIERAGHVYRFNMDPGVDRPSGNFELDLVGVRKASAFSGFCSYHDNQLFEPIDDGRMMFTDEQLFLLAYRALSREMYLKDSLNRLIGWTRSRVDAGRIRAEQYTLQRALSARAHWLELGRSDVQTSKGTFDRFLLAGRFSDIESAVFEVDAPPEILTTGVWTPEYDFEGRVLQDLAVAERAEQVFTSSVMTDSGGAFALSWIRGQVAPAQLARSLAALTDEEIPDALVRFLFETDENLCIAPDWWDSREKVTQTALVRRFNASFKAPRPSDCLLDDGIRAVEWGVNRRHGAASETVKA